MECERKKTFNDIANEYEKNRPTYPAKLFKDIVQYADLDKNDRIIEIGSGTGKATEGFVNIGYNNITCVELGSELIALTQEKFKNEKTINFVHGSFEEANIKSNDYDLAISATAFHFVDPKVGYPKVHRILKKGSSLAFFWTVHVQEYDEIYNQIRELYKKYAPELNDEKMPTPEEDIYDIGKNIKATELFSSLEIKKYKWMHTYTSDEYVGLLNTHSRHRILEKEKREPLLKEIKQIIDNNGGKIEKQCLVALFLGKKI